MEEKSIDSDFIYQLSKKFSHQVFGPIFNRLPFSPNQITIINFLINGLGAAYFFSKGTYIGNLAGLFFCGLSVVFDFMDGVVARGRGLTSKLGEWLDPALDFVWQNILVCAIVFGVFTSKNNSPLWLSIGLFTIVCLVTMNYMGLLYEEAFGFSFYSDVAGFRKKIKSDKDAKNLDKLCLEILAPTNFLFLFFFTIRYFIILGALVNRMEIALIMMTASCFIRGVTLFYVYALFLDDDKKRNKHVIIKVLHSRFRPK